MDFSDINELLEECEDTAAEKGASPEETDVFERPEELIPPGLMFPPERKA